jgi:hypothetical protein
VRREPKTHENDLDGLGLATNIALGHTEIKVIATIRQFRRHASRFGTMLVVVVRIESLKIMLKFAESD